MVCSVMTQSKLRAETRDIVPFSIGKESAPVMSYWLVLRTMNSS